MHYKFLLVCFLLASFAKAQQRPLFIISSTKVYTAPSLNAAAIGIYARGGSAYELTRLPNNWSKVLVENGDTGYLPSKYLVRTLNAKDIYEKDPDDFVSPDDENAAYGSAHLFVTAASLKARAIFAKDKPVVKILRTNEPVGVSYLPYDENKPVRIGGSYFEKAEMIFVPRKYLGRRLPFHDALAQFENSTDAAAKKQLAERVYEMSWLEKKPANLLGVQAFRRYAKETGNHTLYEELAFEEFLLKETQVEKNAEDLLTLFKQHPLTYFVKDKALPVSFTEKDIERIQLPKTIINNGKGYPECGVDVTREYRFANFKVFYSATDKLTYIPEIHFKTNDISVLIAGVKIDHTTTEEVFIKKLGGFLSYSWLERPHVYILPEPDAAAFIFHFKDGKLIKLEYFFYC